MEQDEKLLSEKRKQNMKLYSIHRMLTADLLFYYAIKFVFLTQIKGMTASDIVLATAFFGFFKVIFQIPITVLIDKIGNKKSIIWADIVQIISVAFVMASFNLPTLIIANLLGAVALATKETAESGMLTMSIPEVENKGSVFSKIESKGLRNFYFISAVSASFSGFLFNINGYIPMTICIIILLIAARVASLFKNIENPNKKVDISDDLKERYKNYFEELKLAFSFIFTSRRLKALMLYAGTMYGIIMVLNTYEMGLLQEIKLSASAIGIIYAVMQIVSGIASTLQNKLHKKFRNKTLTIIGMSYTIACLIAGGAAFISKWYGVAIIIVAYTIRYLSTGAYYVLIKKYITNFTNSEVVCELYSAYGIVTGIGNTVIGLLATLIVARCDLRYSMLIFGVISTVLMFVIIRYMKTRVGLNPEDYRKRDINYKEYVSLK